MTLGGPIFWGLFGRLCGLTYLEWRYRKPVDDWLIPFIGVVRSTIRGKEVVSYRCMWSWGGVGFDMIEI